MYPFLFSFSSFYNYNMLPFFSYNGAEAFILIEQRG